jgi:WD40 repeat protein
MVIGDLTITDNARWMVHATIQYAEDTNFTASDWSSDEQSIVGTLTVDRDYTSVSVPAFIKNWHTGKADIRMLKEPDTKDEYRPLLVCNPASITPGVALGTSLGEVFLWDLKEDSAPVRKLDSGGIQGYLRALSWSPDGHWLAASIQDRNAAIVIWKL